MALRFSLRRFRDLISLTFDLIRNNRKFIFPTVIGLIIALVVISDAFILVESSREDLFDEIVFKSTGNNSQYSSDISVVLSGYYPDVLGADRLTDFSHYNAIFDTAVLNGDYEDYVSEYFWFSRPEISLRTGETIDDIINTFFMASSSSKLFNELEDFMNTYTTGRLPQNSSEILIIRPNVTRSSASYNNYIHSISVNSKINLTLPTHLIYMAGISLSNRPNKTVTVTGIVDVVESSYKYSEVDSIAPVLTKYLNHSWNSFILLTQPSYLNEIIDEVYPDRVFEILEVFSSREVVSYMEGKIFLNQTVFNAYQPHMELQRIENFILSLSEGFESWGYNAIVLSNIIAGIKTYITTSSNLLVALFLVGAPVLAVSFFLMIYSFELIKRQRKKQLGIIKTRGGSWKQIVVALYGEIILATVIAAIFGFIISFFLANLALRSTGYMEFLGSQINVRATIDILIFLICIGIFSALLLNFYRIIKTAREDIEEAIVPLETRDPFWKRYYLDVTIFILGTIIWFGMIFLITSLSDPVISENIPIQVFFIIAPFLIFSGSILIIGRLFYFFIRRLAKIAWKIDWGIFPFAVHNIIRYKHAANRAALLLTLAVSFSIISSSLIFSLDKTEKLRFYYIAGADVSFSFDEKIIQPSIWIKWQWEYAVDSRAIQLTKENISHVSSVSTIFTAQGIAIPGLGLTQAHHFNFLFVDVTTYEDTIRNYPEFHLSGDLSSLLEKLNNNASVLLLRKNFNALGAKIGNRIYLPIYSPFFGWNVNRSWRVEGTFSYWPNLLTNTSADYETNFWLIGSLGLLEILMTNSYLITDTLEAKCIVKLDSAENAEEVAESIEKLTGYTPSVPSIAFDEYKESFTRRFNLSVLNTNVIITAIVAIICMTMFAFYISIERGKEIGIERALGITRSQTAQLFLIETSIILCFGIVFGFVTGMFFTAVFFQITQIGALPTPFVIIYPIQIIPILIGIFILSGICTLFPAYLASRTDISRILKVE